MEKPCLLDCFVILLAPDVQECDDLGIVWLGLLMYGLLRNRLPQLYDAVGILAWLACLLYTGGMTIRWPLQ